MLNLKSTLEIQNMLYLMEDSGIRDQIAILSHFLRQSKSKQYCKKDSYKTCEVLMPNAYLSLCVNFVAY